MNRQILKTLWEKEKLLITSNFSFSHNVFYSYQISVSPFVHIFDISLLAIELEESKIDILGKGLREKEEMLNSSIFSIWLSAFSPFPATFFLLKNKFQHLSRKCFVALHCYNTFSPSSNLSNPIKDNF